MKPESSHNTHVQGVIKDSFIIILIFGMFYFMDLQVAAFITIICTSILLTRRIILDYNPGFITGNYITYNEEELIVPKGVDVFDLSKVPTMDYLRRYTEVIRGILVPPTVLIIRFCGILQLEEYDLLLLAEVIGRLQKSDIAIIFSDVGKTIYLQFNEFGIDQKIGSDNIYLNVDDAIAQGGKLLHRHEVK